MDKLVYGYSGKQLRISLDSGKVSVESINPQVLRKYIGGAGYGARILYDELQKGIDPLSKANKLIFATSPLSLNQIPGGGCVIVCFKSPLTNAWSESKCGSDFGPDLKRAGYDAVIIEGRSENPVYIVINDEDIAIKPAEHLTGKSISEKIKMIREELGDQKISVMCIGPAGEKLVKIAVALSDQRAAGRCGVGAVMGSKNLMGIAVKGSKKVRVAQPERLKEAIKKAMKVVRKNEVAAGFKEHGTTGEMIANDAAGDWPTKNWQSNHWGKAEEIYNEFYNKYLIKNHACYRGCPIACGRVAEVKEGKYKTAVHEGCEYESLSAFTAFVLNENVEAAIQASYLCNEYGIDTISAGAIIAFAMECYEHGVIKKKDIGDLDLSWGNPDALSEMIRLISMREGLGDILAEGVKTASKILGKGSEKFAIHGKGLEAPAHDPRSGKALAVTYGTANRGMCHIHPLEGMAYDSGKFDFGLVKYGLVDPNTIHRWDEKGKGKSVKILQDGLIVPDILSTCKFFLYAGLTIDNYADMLSALTGWEIDGRELLKVGERVINLQRLFNIREGFNRDDDLIPERVRQRPSFGIYQDEPRCVIKDYEGMLNEYYEARGWDLITGKPSKDKLRELGLEEE
ncbi:MAG: aldehyde:ferredoxin oxidoreductase [Desulfobacteraceae bacterium 4484_190.3]|nr:MAG: aldehyde:ferredoxin oxidoreductase [Desulfobacteraceae bacterium 4484_190.3]